MLVTTLTPVGFVFRLSLHTPPYLPQEAKEAYIAKTEAVQQAEQQFRNETGRTLKVSVAGSSQRETWVLWVAVFQYMGVRCCVYSGRRRRQHPVVPTLLLHTLRTLVTLRIVPRPVVFLF